ncbi:MFS transporter [Nocardioides panzhihuensis]|uniref:EmrB/QacA subfamily drug resistance transporter n=1 Tax=Nocardioides panzhihuensis TaxID=860243 RepID=A0A7Z0DMB8_9ACTN|nr:MFS transporter [Nocardioides panzhihuensis]NYI78098.1 EmrB/QacA subfamily drug resistance transporter [Nocardioides panzhihuensis]
MTATKSTSGGLVSLLVIASAQLMVVLDDSIVNIALPSIQRELEVAPTMLPWVVNAYILAFGALLLLGGRIGDLWGRKRTLQVGIAVFVVASLVGGVGLSVEMLIAARAVQGLGAALAAPNALALIATTFSERKVRDQALSLYGAMSGLGIVVGLLLGGLLTDQLGWRWVFFINVPIGVLVLLGTRTLVAAERRTGRLGTLGAVLGTAGMVALVYAITRFGESGCADPITYAVIGAALVLLAMFVRTQRSSRNPLVPPSLFRDRNRTGAYLTMLGLAIGPMGTFYVITLYMQEVVDFSPLQTGLTWLPFALGIVLGAGTAPKLLMKIAPRYVAALGALLGAGGAFWFSTISVEPSYWTLMAPAMVLIALGFGLGTIALTQAAVYGVAADRAGIASALLNSAQQIGVALGLTILAGVAATVTVGTGSTTPSSLVDGYSTALVVGAGILLASAVLALLTLRAGVDDAEQTIEEPRTIHV